MTRETGRFTPWLIGAAAGFTLLSLQAAEPLNPLKNRLYPVFRVPAAPVIDGKLDDPGWKGIPEASYFQTPYQRTDSVTRQTGFRIGADSTFLYFAVRCNEPRMSRVSAHDRVQDGWPTVDSVVLLLSKTYNPEGDWRDSPYFMLEFGAGGIHRCHRNLDKQHVAVEAPTTWATAYATDDLHWYIESRIPLSMLEIAPTGEIYVHMGALCQRLARPAQFCPAPIPRQTRQ